MDNNLLDIIKKTTEYIENNILEELNLDNISDNVNVSKFHLLRIWKGATSTGLMEYVRRRRIVLSLSDLMNSNHTMEFISSKYSFGCERTYNRVFKDEFNITPAKWRKNPKALKIIDRFNADFINCAGEGLLFFRSIEILPAFSVAGIEYKVDVEDNSRNQTANKLGVNFFYNHRSSILNPVHKDIYIGYTTTPDNFSGYTYYQPSLQIDSNSVMLKDMSIKHISAHKYGVFTYMGAHPPEEISSSSLCGIWNYVFNIWMPTIQFNLKEQFNFEYIDYSRCNKHYCECDLYYPISLL